VTSAACLPAECTAADMQTSPSVQSFLWANFLPFVEPPPPIPFTVKCGITSSEPWSSATYVMFGVTVGLAGLVALATAYHFVAQYARHVKRNSVGGADALTLPLLSFGGPSEPAPPAYAYGEPPTVSFSKYVAADEPEPKRRQESGGDAGDTNIFVQLLRCFDGTHNLSRMFSVNADRGGETACLNGVRGLSMGMVVIGHALFWMTLTGFVNPQDAYPPGGAMGSDWTFQFIFSAEFAVDSFFFLSGFLVTLSMLKRVLAGKSLNILMLYIHRYLRLTPSYAFALFFYTYILPAVSSGPFWSVLRNTVPAWCVPVKYPGAPCKLYATIRCFLAARIGGGRTCCTSTTLCLGCETLSGCASIGPGTWPTTCSFSL
jgi:hypothetical protein